MRPSYVDIDLRAVAHNVAALAQHVAPAELCTVVKADAYGHGDVPVAEVALANGATWLAVALVEEGIRLREGGIDAPVLLLSEPPYSSASAIRQWKLTPTVYSLSFVEALIEAGDPADPLGVEIKVDTGMHRVGATPSDALSLAQLIVADPGLVLEGVWTHLAVAEEDPGYTKHQVDRFLDFLTVLKDHDIEVLRRHVSNTAGALLLDHSQMTMVRTGIGTYGLYPDPQHPGPVELYPALRVVSAVSHVARHAAGERPSYGRRRPLAKESTVATVPIGYADGVPRRLSDTGGEVLIGGKRFPLAGTVTMDQLVVDMGDEPVTVGDEVVLIGRQGGEIITVEDWASKLDTINYEIVCQIGPRLPRRHLA